MFSYIYEKNSELVSHLSLKDFFLVSGEYRSTATHPWLLIANSYGTVVYETKNIKFYQIQAHFRW